ncbi:Uncharacterised protein [Serratia entomophila]|uniref:Uncharacterized protein n=1 Tax=Serratia entomophila TaxID=42906 RepID=A0ABY5CTJ8_9GAMM|nr:hypothetical protein [Serratia entomophila]UIW18181.1 hypothetical protein KHA73_22740 [Serratia entomophila]USV01065.1 hypothetical protein KFQ06_00440 [Serratia entomophila]CAI0982721.1 Uncharacterised protein [Serratia entomophila]CAI0992970.1 Uncharacterised protein [Serratia entomophila]CAI0997445.1 Uncharacterised protein [Serratia entomophila]
MRNAKFLLVSFVYLCAATVLYVLAYRALGHYLSGCEKTYSSIGIAMR